MRQQISTRENSLLKHLQKKQDVEDKLLLRNSPYSYANTSITLTLAAAREDVV